MNRLQSVTVSAIALSCIFAHAKEKLFETPYTVDLKNPTYKEGVIQTETGGLVQKEGFRLQAEKISYKKQLDSPNECHQLIASGKLMLDFEGQVFIGDSLEYDFLTGTGVLINAKTSVDQWYIEGKKITFFPDKSFEVLGASITTSNERGENLWEMTAEKIHLSQDKYLSTKRIQFKFLKIPLLMLPNFKSNLKSFKSKAVEYKLDWETGQGPRLSMRYRVFSQKNFNVYLRGDYRYARGPGGALEIDYKSDDKRTMFQSKNYVANDTFYNDDNPNKKRKRFRLQGVYQTKSQSEKAEMLLMYDRISDKNMHTDFKPDDFELSTFRQTKLLARLKEQRYIAGLNVEPRINSFQGFKQELPSFQLNVKPLKLGRAPLFFENKFHLAYLDYVYSDDIKRVPKEVANALRDFDSVRAETSQELSAPLQAYGVHFTPKAGFKGILYSDNPQNESVFQSAFTYGACIQMSLVKQYQEFKHKLTPYIDYKGMTSPLKSSDEVYIFDINDGFHQINQCEIGIKNQFFHGKFSSPFQPNLSFNPYAYAFIHDSTFHSFIPKAGLRLGFSYPSLDIECHGRWNFNNQVLDIGNILFKYTFNASLAFSVEYRHRSRYDWRKDRHDDFLLDVARGIPSLLDSPLSDGRNNLFIRGEVSLSPKWWATVQSHFGWGRRNQPGYSEAKVDLYTWLSSAWRLRLSYMHTTRADQFGLGLDLVK